MKDCNKLILFAFILSICGVVIPLIGILTSFIVVAVLSYAKRNADEILTLEKQLIKAASILSLFSLFLWSFSVLLTIFNNSGRNQDETIVFSILFPGLLVLLACYILYAPHGQKQEKRYTFCWSSKNIDGWTAYRYDVPKYGYDFILKLSQFIVNKSDVVLKATTAELAGMPETDRIDELKDKNFVISNCEGFKRECGKVSLGFLIKEPYFSKGQCIQIVMINQLGCLDVFVMGDDCPQDQLDFFIEDIVSSAIENT